VLTVYGSADILNGTYRNIPVERASASFMRKGNDLTIDFLSLNLPNDTDLGLEGSITNGSALDLRFYGGHVDLSLLNRLDERLSFAGRSDFSGEVHGDINDPHVDIKVSATKGQLMHQPFDSLLFRAEGSLSGVGIHDFSMERNGREVWLVNGTIGFTGERPLAASIGGVEVWRPFPAADATFGASTVPATANIAQTALETRRGMDISPSFQPLTASTRETTENADRFVRFFTPVTPERRTGCTLSTSYLLFNCLLV